MRLTLQSYFNRTTFLTSNEDRKCEKLWTLPAVDTKLGGNKLGASREKQNGGRGEFLLGLLLYGDACAHPPQFVSRRRAEFMHPW